MIEPMQNLQAQVIKKALRLSRSARPDGCAEDVRIQALVIAKFKLVNIQVQVHDFSGLPHGLVSLRCGASMLC